MSLLHFTVNRLTFVGRLSEVMWRNLKYVPPPSVTDKTPALCQANVQLPLCDPLGVFVDSLHRGNVVLICQAASLSAALTELMAN